MNWLWTCGGTCFGFREGDNLWTRNGRHVGRFVGQEVYAPDGTYLGEMMGTSRLVTRQAAMGRRQQGFTPLGRRIVHTAYPDYSGYPIEAGFQDFPAPGTLR
ncbi:hypothetical protein PQQ84_31830 [Paraburkholderia strydomiana]|jgi:hypothetical protein|uniref:hypothetical protein n=1 Tax=Paraburkholderia strydomiana TaxID=1245417 RepID=UPI0038B83989